MRHPKLWVVLVALVVILLTVTAPSSRVRAQQPMTAVTLVSAPPAPPSGVGAAVTGFTGLGQTLYYWVVARYPAGLSVPQGPAIALNTPGVGNLSATQFVTVSWFTALGATGYDVIRASSTAFPSPSCAACAVALNTTALSVVDNGGALGAYPPAGIPSAQAQSVTLDVDGRNYSSPVLRAQSGSATGFVPLLTAVPPAGSYPVFGPNATFTSVPILSATCPLCELLANKDAASGYAGLTAGTKLKLAEGQKVWQLSDLSDVTAKAGNSTTVQMAGAGAPALNDCAKYDAGGNIVTFGGPCGTAAPSTFNLSGTFAALPAAGTAGRIYYLTDSIFTHLRDNGASWDYFWHGLKVSQPPSLGWSWDNQGTSTIDSTYGFEYADFIKTGAVQLRARYRNAPAAPYTVRALFQFNIGTQPPTVAGTGTAVGAGLLFRDGTGKLVRFMIGYDAAWEMLTQKWSSSAGATVTTYLLFNGATNSMIQSAARTGFFWLAIQDDNTNLKFYWSIDGIGVPGTSGHWYLFDSRLRTDHFAAGPTQIGFGAYPNGGDVHVALIDWTVI